MKISSEALLEINQIAAQQRLLFEQVEQWCLVNVMPLLRDCKTRDDVNKVFAQILITGDDGQIQCYPGNISVYRAFALDAVRDATH